MFVPSTLLLLAKENLLQTIVTLTVTSIVLNGFYNRYLHPLRHFPGPFWASISDFWKLYICLTKESHTRGIELHKIYGPVVRVAPNLLAFNDPKLLPMVYHRQVDKTDFYSTGILGEIAPPFQTLKHHDHAAKRKRVAPSFSMSNLTKLQGQVDESIVQFIEILHKKFAKTGEKLDFADWARWFVYDAVFQLAFSQTVGFVREGKDVAGLIQAFHNMAPMAGLVAALPWIMNLILKNPIFKRYFMPRARDGTGTGKIMMYRDNLLEHRLKNRDAAESGDFIDNLLRARNADGTLMTVDEIKSEALVLMVAATDTTSAFLCPFVNYIIQDSQIYAKLRAEIQDFELAKKLSSPVTQYHETNELPYFIACVKETLRFSPSTPFILPRYVSQGGLHVGGLWAPEGTEIGANPYVIHRDRAIFGQDADVFCPERWLEDEKRAKEMEKYILSWGYGTRSCLGKNIAQMLTQKLCLQLFRDFRISSVNPKKPWRRENLAIMIYWDQWLKIEELAEG